MFVGARQVQASQIEAEDLGQYQQLIELQKQIVAVAEQNAATQQRCERLRQQMLREFDALTVPQRPVADRLREAAAGWLGRWRKRPDAPTPSKRP